MSDSGLTLPTRTEAEARADIAARLRAPAAHRVEDGVIVITDHGFYEPPVICPRILTRRRRAKIVYLVLVGLSIAAGTILAFG